VAVGAAKQRFWQLKTAVPCFGLRFFVLREHFSHRDDGEESTAGGRDEVPSIRQAGVRSTQREAFIGLAHEERVKQRKGAPRAARIEHVNVRGRRLRLPIAAGRLRDDGDAGVSTTIYKAASQPT